MRFSLLEFEIKENVFLRFIVDTSIFLVAVPT